MVILTDQTVYFTGELRHSDVEHHNIVVASGPTPSLVSIAKTWENINTDHADVKELIPEFYQPPGHFLTNQMV